MKTLTMICFFFLAGASVLAQTTKPTKEQTIQFIKDYYEGKFFGCTRDEGTTTTKYYDSNIKVDLDAKTCIMHISWIYTYTYISPKYDGKYDRDQVYGHSATIDLSKIELIELSGSKQGDCIHMSLKLNAAPGSKFTDVTVNYTKLYSTNEKSKFENATTENKELYIPGGDDEEKRQKLWQAFNHLRKLCGAPDPIKFD